MIDFACRKVFVSQWYDSHHYSWLNQSFDLIIFDWHKSHRHLFASSLLIKVILEESWWINDWSCIYVVWYLFLTFCLFWTCSLPALILVSTVQVVFWWQLKSSSPERFAVSSSISQFLAVEGTSLGGEVVAYMLFSKGSEKIYIEKIWKINPNSQQNPSCSCE